MAERYPSADRLGFLREQLTRPELPFAALVMEDYRRFFRAYARVYGVVMRQARAQGMDVPPVINIHGFGNSEKTFPIGLSQLIEAMELDGMVSATDVYPIFIGEGNIHHMLLVNEMTEAAAAKPDQPLFSIEFQAGGNQDFGGAQSLARSTTCTAACASPAECAPSTTTCSSEGDQSSTHGNGTTGAIRCGKTAPPPSLCPLPEALGYAQRL
ncbi:MAG: hypothetical protein U0452_09875 [Anaerolineae bacterium]